MSFDFLRSATTSSSAFRVVCGEMVIYNNWNVHGEVVIALVRTGSMTLETTTNSYSLNQGDMYFISPNQKYRISENRNAVVDVVLLNLSNPASVTQEYIPQSLIRGLTTGNCTRFAKISPEDAFYTEMLDALRTITKAENEKFDFFTEKCMRFSTFSLQTSMLKFSTLKLRAKSTVHCAELPSISTRISAMLFHLTQLRRQQV